MEVLKYPLKVNTIRPVEDREQLLDALEDAARCYGATHFLATGLPMPDRPLDKLVLRMNWPMKGLASAPALVVSARDPLLRECLTTSRPFIWQAEIGEDGDTGEVQSSALIDSIAARGRVTLAAVPVNDLHPFQGCVLFAGPGITLSDSDLMAFELLCRGTFAALKRMGAINEDRPGDLSDRERLVVELTATGMTASEVADKLAISQRTVHAHLQNASEKLRAANKTHTVVEAIRYGQISV